jgi:hypothetical protein
MIEHGPVQLGWGLWGSGAAQATLLLDATWQFKAMPVSQHHLYEIYTSPLSDLVSAVLSAAHIVELARLRDFN